MITVTLPEHFLQERAYAIHVLLYECLGLMYVIEVKKGAEACYIELGGWQIKIADSFFRRYASAGTYLKVEAIPQVALPATHPDLDGIVCIYGDDRFEQRPQTLDCGVDLIAGTFFMLTRWEEFVDQTRDQHGRFPAQASLAVRAGFLQRPVVNEYAALLKKWLRQIGVKEETFRKRTFQLSLHCDVDTAFYWPSKLSIFRKILFQIIKQSSFSGARSEMRNFIQYLKDGRDPYDTYDRLMSLAEQRESKACFCFLVDGNHMLDGRQTLKKAHVRRIFERIRKRGHLTGVHFSYRTAEDKELMKVEAKEFRNTTGFTVQYARQHVLRCAVPATWHAWERAKVTYDFTLGYPGTPGFRCGTCYAFPLFDILHRRMLYVYERPLIAMDVTFLRYKKCSPEEAIEEAKSLIAAVRKHEGEFVLLWHNSSFAYEWEEWGVVPERLMQEG